MKTLLGILVLVGMLGCRQVEPEQFMSCGENSMGYAVCADKRDRVYIPVDKWKPVKVEA